MLLWRAANTKLAFKPMVSFDRNQGNKRDYRQTPMRIGKMNQQKSPFSDYYPFAWEFRELGHVA
jgi:hypothetical protein